MGFLGFLLGSVLGSLCLVLADRSLTKQSFWGRSYCPHCKKNLRWYDLFPIISFIFLQGRCRYCQKSIKIEYLVVELVLGLLIGYLFYQSFYNFQPILNYKFLIFLLELSYKIFFICILVVLFLTDLKKMLIPDRISLSAIWVSLAYMVGTTIYKVGYLYYYLGQSTVGKLLLPPHSPYFQRHALEIAQPLLGSILSGLGIAGFFTLLIMITRGKGMGGGDVKLGGLIGLALSFPLSLVALLLSFLTGAIWSIFLIIAGKKHFGQSIPFGPFLVLGSLISLFWGNQIIYWYLKLGY